jgi:hypothetical protein
MNQTQRHADEHLPLNCPTRGLHSAPLNAYRDHRTGGKKITEENRMKGTSKEKWTEGRQKEGQKEEGNKHRKKGKRKK